ncbi:uncharacterized protein Hap1MRO34_019228 [Clarias gariepinus]
MLWAVMRFYLLSIALVFCGYTDGFNVWNRTSILDWQAGRSNVTWSQNFQLATPGQLELPSRKGPNGNDGSGNFGNAVLTSEVPPAQRDSSFVQSSGGVAHIKQILNAYGQAAPSHQPNDSSQSSGFYWNDFIKPGNCGPLPSQDWPGKNLPGFQSPSSSQVLGFQTQLYQPSSPTQLSAGQSGSTFQAQGPSASTPYQGQALSWHVSQDQSIPSSQSVVATNPTQSYQPNIPTQVLAGQSALPSQSMGALNLYQGLTSGRYLASPGQGVPSSQSVVTTSQVTDPQAQSFQPSTTTQALTGQSANSQYQSLQALAAYPVQASAWYTTSQGQIPSQVSGFQAQSYQPSTATQFLPGQSASPVQSMGASTLYQALTSGRYLASPGQGVPSSQSVVTTSQVTDAQAQSLQPSTTTQALSGQSAAQDQSFQSSNLPQTSGWYTILLGKVMPSSQVSGVQTGLVIPFSSTQGLPGPSASTAPLQPLDALPQYQMQGSSRTPYWANTTWTTASQSNSMSQSQGNYVTESSGNAKWYSVLQGQIMPSSSGLHVQPFQPGTATQVLSGQSASVQSTGDSTLYQGLTSGRFLASLGQSIPPSPQPMATTNQISGFQNIYWPNTPVSSSQMISLPQSSSASQLFQGQTSGMSSISQDQSIPSSSQSMDTSSQITSSQTQSSFHPTTTTQVLTEQSALAPAQSLGNSPLCSSPTPGWYTTLLGKMIPYSQMSPFQNALQQPSSTSQPAASQAQSMGDSPLYQGLTSNINLTSQYQRTPSSFQSVAALNQISGIQNQSTYWPNTIQLAPSQSAFTPQSQSSGVTTMYQVPAEALPNTSQDQSITASLQSVPSTNQISGFQNQTSYWPSATWVLPGDTHIAQIQSLGNSVSYPSQTSAWNTFLQSKIPSGFQAPSLYQPSTTQILAGQSDSTALLPSLGPMLYQGQALSRYNSQDQSFPSYFPSVATNQISGALSQPSFQPSSTTVASASKPSQAQSSSASAWYQGPTFGSLAAQSQNIPSSSQSVVPTNQFSRFQNLMFQPNTAQAWSWSGSTPQGAPQKIAGITFQGTLPQLSSYGKKWPVTQ